MLYITQYLNMGYLKIILNFQTNEGIDIGGGNKIMNGTIQVFNQDFYHQIGNALVL